MADGLPYALGKIGSESIVDAGIDNADLATSSISGTVIAAQGVAASKLVNSSITATQLGTGCVTTPKHQIIGTGSPVAWGAGILHGVTNTGAGSSVWVTFGRSFLAAPSVVVGPGFNGSRLIQVGSPINAGSVNVLSTDASAVFYWIAAGSATWA